MSFFTASLGLIYLFPQSLACSGVPHYLSFHCIFTKRTEGSLTITASLRELKLREIDRCYRRHMPGLPSGHRGGIPSLSWQDGAGQGFLEKVTLG